MRDTNLVNALREHAEWAEGNQWETPITLGDDLAEAADRIEAQAKEIEKLRRRLKAYEDTGLTPEKIDMDHEAAETLRQLCRGYDLGRLVNLAEADKDGRVVVLPCKVGDTVWAILDGKKHACKCMVEFINIGGLGTTIVLCKVDGLREQYGVTAASFGKTIFLSREEAEAALEAMKDG